MVGTGVVMLGLDSGLWRVKGGGHWCGNARQWWQAVVGQWWAMVGSGALRLAVLLVVVVLQLLQQQSKQQPTMPMNCHQRRVLSSHG